AADADEFLRHRARMVPSDHSSNLMETNAKRKPVVPREVMGDALALPPTDREPSRFAALGPAQKDRIFAVRLSGPTCRGQGPFAVRGIYQGSILSTRLFKLSAM